MRLIEFTGARRIPLVGRQDLLEEADRRIGRGGIHLLYFEGEGGIGKTALLEAILERSQRGSRADAMAGCTVAQEVIDLYHADVHTVEGLVRRMVDVLGRWSFEKTQGALAAFDDARVAGDMRAASEQAMLLQSAFLKEFALLTDPGVVLALDSLEVLEDEQDAFQDELGEEAPLLSAGRWLFDFFFPALQQNVMVLLAGRPGNLPDRFVTLRDRNSRVLTRHIPLEPLSEQESKGVLQAIAQAQGREGNGDGAARLWAFSEERSPTVHLLTGGRPLLLAMVADIVAHDWELPPAFERAPQELLGPAVREPWQEMEKALLSRLLASPAPIGETLRLLAWLRKGATPELLARLMGLRTPDGAWDLNTATGYLDQVSGLALVRVRPGDRRVFLHDEVCALFERYALPQVDEEEKERIHRAIRAYYRDLTRQLEKRAEKPSPVLASILAHLRLALVEEMHYRLWNDPPMGFALYFWLAEEALGAGDVEMDMLVRTEFLRTLAVLLGSDSFLGMVPREAQLDTAVRWGMRALFLQDEPETALKIFDQVRRRWGREAGKLELAWAHLQLYRAAAKIRRGSGDDWQEAREELVAVQQEADRIVAFPPENPVIQARRWRAKILKSLALSYRGSLDRQQGRYLEAVQHLQEAAMLQRRLDMAALAPTLTQLAEALALTGEFHHARLSVEEAERLARRRGKEHLLALTLNVRALVEMLDGHYKAALRYTDQALDVAAHRPTPRVQGRILLTRASAYRYLWSSLTEVEQRQETGLLDEALKEANQAVSLFRRLPVDRVDALLERGCIYRELARLHHAQTKTLEAEGFSGKSREDLERVTVLASAIGLPRQRALAWTNLGWLSYYVGQADEVEPALQQAYQPFPAEYLFNGGSLPPLAQSGRRKEATLPYWSTLGKAEMLKAFLALDRASSSGGTNGHESQLEAAVKHITLSLAYDELIADSHSALTRAEEGLHKRIIQDGLPIKAMHEYAQQIAESQGLRQPTRFQAFLSRIFGPADVWA